MIVWMSYWNVVVTVRQHNSHRIVLLLQKLGTIYRSNFENLFLLNVSNIGEFLGTLNILVANDATLWQLIDLVIPVTATFSFQSLAEFRIKAKALIWRWLPNLIDKTFDLKIHCRGFEESIDCQIEQLYLIDFLLAELEKVGSFNRVSRENPDATIAIETVGSQAGTSFWTREELQRYPMLKLNCHAKSDCQK